MSARVVRWAAFGASLLALAGCSAGGAAKFLLGGGGPNVAANVQAGKTNAQTLGETRVTEQRVDAAETVTQSADENRVRADRVERVVVNEVPLWAYLIGILGWLLPSPGEIGRGLSRLIVGKRAD